MVSSTKVSSSKRQQQQLYIVGGIVVVAVVIALIAIVISSNSRLAADTDRLAEIPTSFTSDGAPVLGNPDAPITIVEFADFLCPACQQYKPTIDEFIEKHVMTGEAKLEYRTLITAGGETTRYAAQLAECAERQREGGFWEAYEVLYELAGGRRLNMDVAQSLSDRLNLDRGQLISCSRTARQVVTDEQLARSLGASSTPTVMVRYGDARPVPVPNRRIDGLTQLVQAANAQ
jgi:protein-disulfide isomerase